MDNFLNDKVLKDAICNAAEPMVSRMTKVIQIRFESIRKQLGDSFESEMERMATQQGEKDEDNPIYPRDIFGPNEGLEVSVLGNIFTKLGIEHPYETSPLSAVAVAWLMRHNNDLATFVRSAIAGAWIVGKNFNPQKTQGSEELKLLGTIRTLISIDTPPSSQ